MMPSSPNPIGMTMVVILLLVAAFCFAATLGLINAVNADVRDGREQKWSATFFECWIIALFYGAGGVFFLVYVGMLVNPYR